MANIVILEGVNKGQTFTLNDSITTIGRAANNDIMIDNSSVSSIHCRIEHTADGFTLVDQDSTNGSRVNDSPVRTQALFRDDVIRVGDVPLSITGGDVPKAETLETQSVIDCIPRTTIVMPPRDHLTKTRNVAIGFTKKSDHKQLWGIVITIMSVIVIIMVAFYVWNFFLVD